MATTTNLHIDLPTPSTTTSWGSATNPASGTTTGSGVNYVFNEMDKVFAAGGTGTPVGLKIDRDPVSLAAQTLNIASYGTLQATGTVILGQDGASASGNTLRAGNITGNNLLGPDLTIQAGNGTGTNSTTSGSGKLLFKTAPANTSGASSDPTTMVTRMTITKDGYVGIGQTTPTYNLDVGTGGTASTNGQQSIRLNGSNAGTGSNGGAIITLANNSTSTGAIGNYSSVLGTTSPTTAYTADLTIASSSSLRFLTGATIAGGAASTEKMRLGTLGQIGLWDATLTTPAINYGTSGQVMKSGGSSGPAVWGSGTSTLLVPTSVGTSTSYTITSSTITSAFSILELSLYALSHGSSGNNRYVTIEISGDTGTPTTWTTAAQITPNDDSSQQYTGTVKIINAGAASGTRLILAQVGLLNNNNSFYNFGYSYAVTGYVKAIRLTVSSGASFDGGTVALTGY
jgi:hypothetical protein